MSRTKMQERAMNHLQSICVVAGAGTGKTKVLVDKYLYLLENVKDLEIQNILSLTFTEKAAAEMKERIRNEISKKSGDYWEKIQEDFIWADISTFHSFCTKVLREFSSEAGIDPNFSVIDELEADKIRRDAMNHLLHSTESEEVKNALMRLMGDASPWHIRKYLLELYNKHILAEKIFTMMKQEKNSIIEKWKQSVSQANNDGIAKFFHDAITCDAVNGLKSFVEKYKGDKDPILQYLRYIEMYIYDIDPSKDIDVIKSALIGFNEISLNRRFKNSKVIPRNDVDKIHGFYGYLKDFIDDILPSLQLSLDDDIFVQYALRFLNDLSIAFQEYVRIIDNKKRQLGGIDFSDMINYTYKLLRDNEELVERYFRDKYRYILVDEFQDTDPVQYEIILRILGDLSQKTERLFIVGDPKQSIYLFRDADVTLFSRIKRLIKKDFRGEIIPLDISFRSTPQVIGFVNYLFEKLLANNRKDWESGYDPIRVSSKEEADFWREDDKGSVEMLYLSSDGNGSHEQCRIEAEAIARRLQYLVENEKKKVYWDTKGSYLKKPREACYGDISILLHRRTNLGYFEWALRKYGIPYHVSAGLGYYERQEVLDLYNILRFLENELDDIALYGILRSPYFGISDADLFRVAKSGSGALWWRLKKYVKNKESSELQQSVKILEDWLDHSHRESITDLVLRIIKDSGIYFIYGSMHEGEQIVANVEKFISIARRVQSRGFISLTDFLLEFKELIDELPKEGEAAIDIESGDNVRIMTVHASKGLEFPIVVVPDMSASFPPENHHILIHKELGIGLKLPNPEQNYELQDTFLKKMLSNDLHEKSREERKRLLYVACTRAKDHLILSGIRPKKKKKALWKCKSWMEYVSFCLESEGNDLEENKLAITDPLDASRTIILNILSDPQKILAVESKPEPILLDIPEDIDSEETLPDNLRPIDIIPQEHVYSPTEIEEYLCCPQKYYHIYRMGRPQRDVTVSAIGENAQTRGLIIHEIFQGKNAEVVLKKYGVIDPQGKIAKKYGEAYNHFLKSEMMKDIVEEYKELPFNTWINGILYSGKIDRLVKKEDGSWILIDYKTGEIKKKEKKEKIKEYSIQLAIYEKAVEQILGVPVCSYVYFTEIEEFQERVGKKTDVLKTAEEIAKKIKKKEFRFTKCDTCKRQYVDHKLSGYCPLIKCV